MTRSSPLQAPVQYVKGVGPARASQLARLGIQTVEDLLYHRPHRYEDRRHLARIADLVPGRKQSTEGTVVAVSEKRYGTYQFFAALSDESGVLQAMWFGQRYLRRVIRRGARIIVYGKVERFGALTMTVEDFELLTGDAEDTLHTGRIVPVHSATEGLSPRVVRTIIAQALAAHVDDVPEILPGSLRKGRGLMDRATALRLLHFPETMEQAEDARRRLAFDELLVLQCGVLLRRQGVHAIDKGFRYAVRPTEIERFVASLPYALTGAQQRVIGEILSDMHGSAPMNRLLQGDVGSGKTVVAAAALHFAVRGGHQGALMAPTEILAEQHAVTFRRLLDPLGLRLGLVTGGVLRREREATRDALRRGEIDIAIGTHALLEAGVEFRRLGLVVVDEQHKFGVMQRAVLRQKGFHPDVLVMTATPIPRTLTMTLYGDLDVAVLDELPPGRGVIKTYVRGPEKRAEVYTWVHEKVREGQQAYVVCPLIEESEKLQVEAAAALAERLRREHLRDVPLEVLHGRLRPGDKERVMEQFRRGAVKVLVATSVIEVGIDVPQATIMVIEDADRFGLAQLHQLRGRIGRGAETSYCVLLAAMKTETARMRLETMAATHDGFVIAQKDLELRGPGELLGTRQHGLPDLRVANLLEDQELLEAAREDAMGLLRDDPALREPQVRALGDAVRSKFGTGRAAVAVS
ncbi:MAG TPA: ATP-dependent DNA helicase RecG [bacterium]|nr:ATP-dependent DNA helicase RecG [bacterium]